LILKRSLGWTAGTVMAGVTSQSSAAPGGAYHEVEAATQLSGSKMLVPLTTQASVTQFTVGAESGVRPSSLYSVQPWDSVVSQTAGLPGDPDVPKFSEKTTVAACAGASSPASMASAARARSGEEKQWAGIGGFLW